MLLSLGLIALLSQAQAFVPAHDLGPQPDRVWHAHAPAQVLLQQQAGWQDFTQGEGMGWHATFDELTGTPHRMWGAGISLGPTGSAKQVEMGLRDFLARHSGLLGIEPGSLGPAKLSYVARLDTWFVDIPVMVGGAPLYHAGITARIRKGRLILLGADTYPGLPLLNSSSLSPDQALASAIQQGAAPGVAHQRVSVRRVVLPDFGDTVGLRQMFEVRTRTTQPLGHWVALVDASSGELAYLSDEVRYFEGTIQVEHDERTVDGSPLVTSPVPLAEVFNNVDTTNTDALGAYSFPDGSDPATTGFSGEYVQVFNSAGDDAVATVDATSPDLLWTDAEATLAERDTYVALHTIRAWGEIFAPDLHWVQGPITAKVNMNQDCNAYYDGSVNFFTEGGPCNNTGRISDVIHHEWGHGLHDSAQVSGWEDPIVGEAAADIVAFLQTADNRIGPYFFKNGTPVRDVAPNMIYPEDYDPNSYAPHENGLILGGSMWDLWSVLEDAGDPDPHAVLSQILVDSLRAGPTIESFYYDALAADDDDADLSNGTPHECELLEAFSAHGLGPIDATSFLAGHEPVVDATAGGEHELVIYLDSPVPNCFQYDISDAKVSWRVNGGEWESQPLTVSANEVRGAIPDHPAGSFIEYYLTLDDSSGLTRQAPTGGEINPYSFYVGDVLPVACTDFEADDGGYTHELVSGKDSDGADDWTWGRPRGMAGDPESAHSGTQVWGNDLGGGNFNGAYQADKHNRLISPTYSYPAHYSDIFLEYWRWLNVEDGIYDQGQIRIGDEVVWSNYITNLNNGKEHTLDNQWMPQAVDLQGLADGGEVQLSWELITDGGAEFGGWNIDDVCLFAPDTPDNRLGISDFVASDGEVDAVTLSWTNPGFAPLRRVVVVRSPSAFPTGPTDGEVIFEDASPELGAAVSIQDTEITNETYFYAVYASDGNDWASFTEEGWNADIGNGVVPDSGGDGKGKKGGCGCSTTSPASGWLLLGLVGMVLRRRQRARS